MHTYIPSRALQPQASPVGPCKCKKNRCLKLYCGCFQSGDYCSFDCSCLSCQNTVALENLRQDAIRAALERNPAVFQGVAVLTEETSGAIKRTQVTGCNCKNSACLKKYCGCFRAGERCADGCKCTGCKVCMYGNESKDPRTLGDKVFY
ncbi:hypothetical protein JKP88DRAFT_164906 [Tribonema minus]|uniref:CRC domain-containing protein n=1 Tax=Tribonema minus TaxID=303371 RepID=A0A835YV21_9STRA|nr:hypothetical protein JKP88DRAFT_164906 [Tribonema minus]